MRLDDPLISFITFYQKDIAEKNIDYKVIDAFKKAVWDFYKINKRLFQWRENITQYCVVVSEIMLQQTQTSRVKEKFSSFIAKFSDFNALAAASTAQVIGQWIGLGYNRRALALHQLAKKVVTEWNGQLPNDLQLLQTCKGIGPATAASMTTFAFNQPTVFIETNIRTVFLHIFFHNQENISDADVMPLIALMLDQENPREWYYALMDYGVLLKKLYKNPSRKSKHYAKQSTFKGSDRQLRGSILKILSKKTKVSKKELFLLDASSDRIEKILNGLVQEGFIACALKSYFLTKT